MSRIGRLCRSSLGLRGRLSAGMLLISFAACIGFALAAYEFVDVLQDKILQQTLTRELHALSADYRHGMPITRIWRNGGRVFVSRTPRRDPQLPEILRHVRAGRRHYTLPYRGHTYYVGRRDVDGAALYLMINVDSVKSLKHRLGMLGGFTLGVTIMMAFLIALVFAWVILRPVRQLAERLSDYRPGQPNPAIAADYDDRDVRAIARSFDELIQRFDAAIAREKAFTEDASHELRTPLTVALNANELLSGMKNLDARARRRAIRARDACERMQSLVSALLFLARDDSGDRCEQCDAAIVLDKVLFDQHDALKANRLELSIHARSSPLPLPEGVVYSVLHNLIGNAIRHTEDGRLSVVVTPERIEVSDTGCGIPEVALARIFERRYRTADSPGLGLGLHLVSRICDRQGWPISVRSMVGSGTSIEIRIDASSNVG